MEIKYCDVCGMIIKNKVENNNPTYTEKEKEVYGNNFMFAALPWAYETKQDKPKNMEECIKQQIENMPFDLCNECKKYIYENYIGWLSDRRTATHTLLKEK